MKDEKKTDGEKKEVDEVIGDKGAMGSFGNEKWRSWGYHRAKGGRDIASVDESADNREKSEDEESTEPNPYTHFDEYTKRRNKRNEKYL